MQCGTLYRIRQRERAQPAAEVPLFKIDPSRSDLAIEFRARPYGEHSPQLQAVLSLMRSRPPDGRYVLICTKPHEEWVLARISGDPPRAEMLDAATFTSLEEAEWAVFRMRWKALTGEEPGP